MKKSLILLSAALLILSSLTFADTPIPFTDLQDTHWAKEAIDTLAELEIINGYPDGTFKPDNPIKINEFITMTMKSMDYHFESMSTDWAKPYIDKAIELGVIENKEFSKYTADITRQQMASIVVNALSLSEAKPSNLMDNYVINDMKDYHKVDDYYKQNVLDSYKFGIVTGYPDGRFLPQGLAKRSEASKVLVTMMNSEERNPYENLEVKSTMVPIVYVDENNEDAIRYEKMYAPLFNGKPVNEVVEVIDHFMSLAEGNSGFLSIGANPHTHSYSVIGYPSKAFYDSIFENPSLYEQSFLVAERKDFDLTVEPLDLTNKHSPYYITLWKTQVHVDDSIAYGKYFTERYQDQMKPFFDILFEEESQIAWTHFMTALNHEDEWEQIEETINGRYFSVDYSKSGVTLSISLKR